MIKKYIIPAISILLLTACGGGGSSSDTDTGTGTSTTMVPNQSYTVYPGDRLFKNTPDTIVKITHTDGSETSTVELVAGEATIIRKSSN